MIKIGERFTKVVAYVSYKPTLVTCDHIAYAMTHKGKATSDVYNPDDPPEAYTNRTVYNRINDTRRWQGLSMEMTTTQAPRTLI
jgi:hypothetical protein